MSDKNYYQHAKHHKWRDKVLRRAKYKCEECARYGRTAAATVAHHKQPREQFPELQYSLDNGQALCASCHNAKHPEKGAGWRKKG